MCSSDLVTLYNELNVLKARGVSPRIFAPDDYGISVPRDTLFTSEKTAAEKPKLVQAFTNATLRGWKYAIQNPVEAVKDADVVSEDAFWKEEVAKSAQSQRAETIGRAYDGAVTRAVRMESKAVGLLQVIAKSQGLLPEPVAHAK